MEVFLTRMRYRRLGNSGYEYMQEYRNSVDGNNFQNRRIDGEKSKFYTSIIWDLIDNFNQRIGYGRTISTFPNDNTKNFTMPQLEKALKGAKYWNGYRDNVRNQNPSNATINNVNQLFANWQ